MLLSEVQAIVQSLVKTTEVKDIDRSIATIVFYLFMQWCFVVRVLIVLNFSDSRFIRKKVNYGCSSHIVGFSLFPSLPSMQKGNSLELDLFFRKDEPISILNN